jgi:mannose-6-phosphate isomerase-like protein (cupin superfamily)
MPNRVIHTRVADLPREAVPEWGLERTALRGDGSLIVYNWQTPSDDPAAPPHSHPFDQTALILQGKVEITVDDEVFVLRQGEALQIPAGAPHTGRTVGDQVALIVDVFAPAREDYLHLAAHQSDAFAS